MKITIVAIVTLMFEVIVIAQSTNTTKKQSTTVQKKPNLAADSLIKLINFDVTLKREEVSRGTCKVPSWIITIKIINKTEFTIQLGETLMAVEKSKTTDDFIGVYQRCEGNETSLHTKRLQERYGLSYGYTKYKHGKMNIFFTKGMPCYYFMQGSGYKNDGFDIVKPRETRQLDTEIETLYTFKKDNIEYVALILPSITIQNISKKPLIFPIYYFKVNEQHDPVNPAFKIEKIRNTSVNLISVINDKSTHVWKGLFALNWLSESYPNEANKILMDIIGPHDLQVSIPTLLYESAILNCGLTKNKSVTPIFVKILNDRPFENIKQLEDVPMYILNALGDIKDTSSLPIIRKYINDKSKYVAESAIATLGQLKDTSSISLLLDKIENEDKFDDIIIESLSLIGNKKSIDYLIKEIEDTNSKNRKVIAKNAFLTNSKDIIPSLLKIASDTVENNSLRKSCINSLGKMNAVTSVELLCSCLTDKNDEICEEAISALVMIKHESAKSCLNRYKNEQTYKHRDYLLKTLNK